MTNDMEACSKSFNLRWNNHLENLRSLFECLFNEQILVDVTIACQDGLLKVMLLPIDLNILADLSRFSMTRMTLFRLGAQTSVVRVQSLFRDDIPRKPVQTSHGDNERCVRERNAEPVPVHVRGFGGGAGELPEFPFESGQRTADQRYAQCAFGSNLFEICNKIYTILFFL